MANSIFVTATQRGSGKSTVVLGLINILERSLGRVGYFKPIGQPGADGVDPDVRLMKDALGLEFSLEDMTPVSMAEVREALARGTYDEIVDRILEAFHRIAEKVDFVVCEGTDYFGAMSSFEFDINADVSKNLDSPVVLVANANGSDDTTVCPLPGTTWEAGFEAMMTNLQVVKESFDEKSCDLFGVILNRCDPKYCRDIHQQATERLGRQGVKVLGTLPRHEMLEKVRLEEIVGGIGSDVISGRERLDAVVRRVIVAAMSLENVLQRMDVGDLVLVPGDREDVLLGVAAAYSSPHGPSPVGIVMTGGLEPRERVKDLVLDVSHDRMPILKVDTDTYDTAIRISNVKPSLQAHQRTRIEVVKDLVERQVDSEPFVTRAGVAPSARRVTPKAFIHKIVDLARADRRHIVLPEGKEERILKAAEVLLQRNVVDLTLLGDVDVIRDNAARLGLKLERARLVNPNTSEWREPFAKRYIELRSPKKNPTWDLAYDLMSDANYFGTMMVQEGYADGMVSGSITTTAATLRPALEFVKTREGVRIASSVFFMALPDSVLVYGDCAVNPNPGAEELADIALASAETAAAFEIEPRVAMLSYSTGASGKGSDVDKVREATRIIKDKNPSLLVEGPIQYDAAVDPGVARTKLPDSKVAGRATVFVFPDLNSGNNTYKAVQRSARAIAIGPVMQGLRKPVNDLSRGCTIPDIINTVAITAIQAQRS